MAPDGRVWARRLRWRLRGGTQWPTFAIVTVGDGLLLHYLPPLTTGFEVIPGVIVASFANLFLVGAVAPWLARRIGTRRDAAAGRPPVSANGPAAASRQPPYEVVLDRAATGLLLAGALGLLAAGLASQPLIVSETEATELNAEAVRGWVLAHGTSEQRRNIDTANTIRLSEGYFRTCLASDDRRRVSCLFVDTNRRPPEVREDTSPTPNQDYLGRSGSY
jgi:hypothetical protein